VTEKVVRDSDKQYRLVDANPHVRLGLAIFSIDINGACTFCNAACIRLLGYSHESELLALNMHARCSTRFLAEAGPVLSLLGEDF